MTKQKGFTLIELLVVIAIIGILSSIVLASLNSARNKGKDASAKASMSSIRGSAEIYYNGTGANSYGSSATATATYTSTSTSTTAATSVCTDADVTKLGAAAAKQTGNSAVCNSTPTTYTVYEQLLDSTYFCVDGTGFAGTIANVTSGTGTGSYQTGIACKNP